jgi:ATP-dependent Clp protease ATP-binding subunit ClpA
MFTSTKQTEDARIILEFAGIQTRNLGRSIIEPEEILYAILVKLRCAAGRMLIGMAKYHKEMSARLVREAKTSEHGSNSNDLMLSSVAERVCTKAIYEANICSREEIDSIDLLLGILALGHGVAWQILIDNGITSDEVRAIRQQRERHDNPVSEYAHPASTVMTDGLCALVQRRFTMLSQTIPILETQEQPLTTRQVDQYIHLLTSLYVETTKMQALISQYCESIGK